MNLKNINENKLKMDLLFGFITLETFIEKMTELEDKCTLYGHKKGCHGYHDDNCDLYNPK